MTQTVYIVQKWMNSHWYNDQCFSSMKKAKYFVSEKAYEGKSNEYRIFTMQLI